MACPLWPHVLRSGKERQVEKSRVLRSVIGDEHCAGKRGTAAFGSDATFAAWSPAQPIPRLPRTGTVRPQWMSRTTPWKRWLRRPAGAGIRSRVGFRTWQASLIWGGQRAATNADIANCEFRAVCCCVFCISAECAANAELRKHDPQQESPSGVR